MGLISPAPIRGDRKRQLGFPVRFFIRMVLIVTLLAGWLGLPLQAAAAPDLPQALLQALPSASLTQVVDLNVGTSNGAAAWGDFNNDGNPDLLVSGLGYAGTNLTRTTLFLYNADKATLEPIDLGLPNLEASSIAWGDYDRDGYLDLLLTGREGSKGFAGVYHNIPHVADSQNPSARTFTLVQELAPVYQGTAVWGDYDNDGRLDILLSGYTGLNAPFTALYHNDGGSFSPVAAPVLNGASSALVPLGSSAAAWQDYDKDGYLDLVITGKALGAGPTTLVYHNHNGMGFDAPIRLPGLWDGTVNWIDFAGDGFPGLLLTGNAGMNNSTDILPTTRLYRLDLNAANPFVEAPNTGLPNVWNSSVSVGDFNNDGYPDIALNGMTSLEAPTDVYINQHNGTFRALGADLPHSSGLSLAWGDFNADRSLDLAVTGILQDGVYHTKVFLTNNASAPRSIAAPAPRAACWDGANQLVLMWTPPASSPTAPYALTYNPRVGTTPGGSDVLSPSSDLASGDHRLPEPGSAGWRGFTRLSGLTRGQTYYWSVQAEDAGYLGGPFSPTMSIPYGQTIAVDDAAETVPNTAVTVDVLKNDHAIGLGPLAVYSVGAGAHGKTAINAQGQITYTPDANFVGKDSFAYYAIDQTSLYCTSARVTVSVAHADQYPPTDISLSHASVSEGMLPGALVGRFTTTDADNPLDFFTYTLVSNSCAQYSNGLFTIQGDALLTAQPLDHRKCGTYTIRVRATDNGGKSIEKDFTITATPSLPSLAWMDEAGAPHSGVAEVSMSEDSAPLPFKLTLLANDPGTAETLTWSIAQPPAHGQADAGSVTEPGQLKRDIRYTPDAGWTGLDCFELRVTDPYDNTATILVNVSVLPGNQAPTLDPIADQVYAEYSGPQVIELSGITPGAGESGSQSVSVTASVYPSDGAIQAVQVVYPYQGDSTRGQVQFTAGAGAGDYSLTVTVDDHQSVRGVFSQTVKLSVTPGPRTYVYLPLVGQRMGR